MKTRKNILSNLWVVVLLVAIMTATPLLLTGCGGCQKEEPAPTPPAPKAAPKAAAPEAAKPEAAPAAPMGAVVPLTLDVLKLAPTNSMVAVALPPISGLYEKGLALAKRIAPEDLDIEGKVSDGIALMADGVGASDATSLADIAKTKGIDPDAPIGLFIDLAPIAKGIAGSNAGELSALGDALEFPGILLVLGCSDPAVLEATLKESLTLYNDLDESKLEDIEAGGVVIHSYGANVLSYVTTDKQMLVSNSVAMIEGALAGMTSPAAFSYGSKSMPASQPDEIVIMTWMNKLQPLIKDLLPTIMALSPDAAQYASMNMNLMIEALSAMDGDDPLVTTLALSDSEVDLISRMDISKHPKMIEYAGEPKPLRLAPLLPSNTLLALSIGLNEKTKKNILDTLANMPPELANEGLQGAQESISKAFELIGDEITLGLTDMALGMPAIFLMASMANPEEGKAYLTDLLSATPSGEKHGDVELMTLALPSPIPLHMAMANDVALLGNDLEKLKGIIELLQNNKQSDLFASLDPALDPATPRYSMLLFNSRLLSEVVIPLSGFAGGAIPPEASLIMNKVSEVVREIRAVNDVKNNILEKGLIIYLKPAA